MDNELKKKKIKMQIWQNYLRGWGTHVEEIFSINNACNKRKKKQATSLTKDNQQRRCLLGEKGRTECVLCDGAEGI